MVDSTFVTWFEISLLINEAAEGSDELVQTQPVAGNSLAEANSKTTAQVKLSNDSVQKNAWAICLL